MSVSPLVGPADGVAGRLVAAEPGRLAVDDLVTGDPGAGWVEPVGMDGATAMVRLATSAVAADAAVTWVLESVLTQVAGAGARRLVLETDDGERQRVLGGGPALKLGVEVIPVPVVAVTNSLGRRSERLVTLVPGQVGIYSCGPTVYSYQHLGNMRPYVFVDTLKRFLAWRGLDVRHVINITDVGHLLADADQGEDKVEEASVREGRSVAEITGYYSEVYWDDLRSLNVGSPDGWPHASAYVPQMINFAQVLEDRGYGYRLDQGLYFDTARLPDYGELAGIDTTTQRETGRVEMVEGKRAKADFALWRTFTDGRDRLMQWSSPWGVGAPGWHLECSVMSISLLGDHFDIHTGGIDHRDLHHVNEIAQSEAYLGDGRRWVRYWLHNEFLNLKGAKMAKSAGAIMRLADLTDLGVHPLAYRYLLLGSQYSSQLEFAEAGALAAHQALRRLVARVAEATNGPGPALGGPLTLTGALEAAAALGSSELTARLLALDAALADDLQTPQALALVSTWFKGLDDLGAAEWRVLVAAVDTLLGLRLADLRPADFVAPLPDSIDPAWVQDRLSEREAARAARDFEQADRMRQELADAGIRVEDTPDGTHWYTARPGS